MPPAVAPNVQEPETPAETKAPGEEQDNPTPQFQLVLRATDGDHVMAASDTVNDLVDQAKYWLNASDEGAKITDAMVRSVVLQEVDPATGSFVDSQELPVESRNDILGQARKLGARS